MSVVAVTGASGKTGRTVVEHLSALGVEVRAIDSTGAAGDRGDLPVPVSGARSSLSGGSSSLGKA